MIYINGVLFIIYTVTVIFLMTFFKLAFERHAWDVRLEQIFKDWGSL